MGRTAQLVVLALENESIFLMQNRDGKISRRELRKLLRRFRFDISEAQFRELMLLLDPQHTNLISYQHFLNLFEPRETKVMTSRFFARNCSGFPSEDCFGLLFSTQCLVFCRRDTSG